MNAGRAQLADEEAGEDGALLCGSCRDEAEWIALRDELRAEVARLRAALEKAERALSRAARNVPLLVQHDAELPYIVCKARDGAREALNGEEA